MDYVKPLKLIAEVVFNVVFSQEIFGNVNLEIRFINSTFYCLY